VTDRDVAIVGMACMFPKAPDLATYWRNIREGVDAITDVPPARWDPRFYDPDSSAPDRFYARRGGFIISCDHQTPPGVSYDQYQLYLRLFREYGRG